MNYQISKNRQILAIKGGILKTSADALVNTSDRSLSGRGAVDRAFHKTAGIALREACNQLNGCKIGEAKITRAFDLSAQWIIHTVAPCWQWSHQDSDLLSTCYKNCLTLAEQYKVRTIAFPSIGTGALGCPIDIAADIAFKTVRDFLTSNQTIEVVTFVCFDHQIYDAYLKRVSRNWMNNW
jgi:O-acetyl-ADP-ribose deacetylase (regulator of RNase III)